MVTLGDVLDKMREVKIAFDFFGCNEDEAEFCNELMAAFRAAGAVQLEEGGISKEEARSLPRETVFGPRAEAAYRQCLGMIARARAEGRITIKI